MFTQDEFRQVILSGTAETQARFIEVFSQEIEVFINDIFHTYKIFHEFDQGADEDYRKAYTCVFLFNAIKSITESLTVYLLGFHSAAGNLMRHYFESIAMALLISNNQIDAFERYKRSPRKFHVHGSVDLVVRHANDGKLTLLSKEAWNAFMKEKRLYDKYSHPSALSAGHLFHSTAKGATVLGGMFDPGRVEDYRKEIQRYSRAAAALKNAIHGIRQEMS